MSKKKHTSTNAIAGVLAELSNNETLDEIVQAIAELQEKVNACPFTLGSILCLINDTDPNDLYPNTTWEKIEGKFLLGSSSDYELAMTGGEATHTLSSEELPLHSHSMSDHTHSVGEHSHGLNNHTHGMSHTHGVGSYAAASNGAHQHNTGRGAWWVRNDAKNALVVSEGYYSNEGWTSNLTSSAGAHGHSITGTSAGASSSTTGGASGNTANNSAFNSGGPSNNTTGNAGGNTAHNNMPPYLVVNIWKRVA